MKKTLSLMVAAAVQARSGNHVRAAALLQAASGAPDLRSCVAHLRTLSSARPGRRATAAVWPFAVTAAGAEMDQPTNYGSDLRLDVEGGLDDDLDLMGLGGDDGLDDGLEMAGFEDDGLGDDGFDEFAAAEDDEDDEDDEDEDEPEEKKEKTESRRIAAALSNLAALAAAKKKKKVVKRK